MLPFVAVLLTIATIVLAGCSSAPVPEGTQGAPTRLSAGHATYVTTASFSIPEDAGAPPANTLNAAGIEYQGNHYFGIDDPWGNRIHLSVTNETGQDAQRSSIEVAEYLSVEFLAIGLVREKPWVAFRNGFSQVVMINVETPTSRVVFDAASTFSPTAIVVGLDTASNGEQMFVSFSVIGLPGVTAQVVLDVETYAASGTWTSFSTIGAMKPGAIAVTASHFGLLWPNTSDSLMFLKNEIGAPSGEGTIVYEEPSPDAVVTISASDLRFASDNSTVAIRTNSPIHGDMQTDRSIYGAVEPDWNWTNLGVSTMDPPLLGMYHNRPHIAFRETPSLYEVGEWIEGGEIARLAQFTCKVGFETGGQFAGLLFVYQTPESVSLIFGAGDVAAMSLQSPCQE